MKYRNIGEGGFEVSEVGLGCWQIGADWGNKIEESNAMEILRQAVASGITFFDTADVYGDGRSEELIGQFLKETDSKIRVATKFGRNAKVFPDNYSQKRLIESIEGSKKRLGVTSLDLLQLHCIPTDELRKGKVFDWLREQKDAGNIRSFGASVESVEEGLICLEQEGLQSLQVIFNVFRQKLVTDLLPQAKSRGVGIIVRLPLASGLLTGKFDRNTTFEKTDHRQFNRDGQLFNVGETFAGLPFEKGIELTDRLKALCPQDMTLTELALRWLLDHEEVSSIIPGASSVKHVAGNAKASALPPLSNALTSRMADFYEKEVRQHIRGVY